MAVRVNVTVFIDNNKCNTIYRDIIWDGYHTVKILNGINFKD